ncbi:amino acid adenylation domain-containing protein [Cohnella soli]|uniref:Amino acid adenylation domain-containing protein n=1 Tax=Cohnella soli TaxID=425005 RepID=A0ABW0I1D5_9BACL
MEIEDKNITAFIGETAKKMPDKPAVTFESRSLTYSELMDRVERLADKLRMLGVQNQDIVAILLEQSLDLLVSILAVLTLGGIYVPIDLRNPPERVQSILKDANAKFLIRGKHATVESLELHESQVHVQSTPHNLAYIIYTSGSTGKPKGVMIEHRSVGNLIRAMAEKLDLHPGKKILVVSPPTFDIYLMETIVPLSHGMEIVIANDKQSQSPRGIRDLIVNDGIDMVQMTPSRWVWFLNDRNSSQCLNRLTDILIGGEPLRLSLLQRIKSSTEARIYNLYGPTEATVWTAIADVTDAACVTIGVPIANTSMCVMDPAGNLLEEEVGELHLSGIGLARGYWNDPELTKNSFIESHERRYFKTGDLAKKRKDGSFEVLGRTDEQVKIRGHRVELREVENVLIESNLVSAATVICFSERLIAFIVPDYPAREEQETLNDIFGFLKSKLPDYMIPSSIVILADIPITANGKTDKKALLTIVSKGK